MWEKMLINLEREFATEDSNDIRYYISELKSEICRCKKLSEKRKQKLDGYMGHHTDPDTLDIIRELNSARINAIKSIRVIMNILDRLVDDAVGHTVFNISIRTDEDFIKIFKQLITISS